jgi:hypothetical protein
MASRPPGRGQAFKLLRPYSDIDDLRRLSLMADLPQSPATFTIPPELLQTQKIE